MTKEENNWNKTKDIPIQIDKLEEIEVSYDAIEPDETVSYIVTFIIIEEMINVTMVLKHQWKEERVLWLV